MKPFEKDGVIVGCIESDVDENCRHKNAKPTWETCKHGCCTWYHCHDCDKTF